MNMCIFMGVRDYEIVHFQSRLGQPHNSVVLWDKQNNILSFQGVMGEAGLMGKLGSVGARGRVGRTGQVGQRGQDGDQVWF